MDRVTLLVIPARDLHPLGERSPEMTSWLAERRVAGDSIAQHGFQHERMRPAGFSRRSLLRSPARRAGEFVGLDVEETQRAVNAGWRVLKLAGVEPDGFVAPAYAYTPALRSVLPGRFRWWAGLLRLHHPPALPGSGDRARLLAPAWGMGTDGPLRRALSPALIRAGACCAGRTCAWTSIRRISQHPRHMIALERVLHRAGRRREAITYDELLASRNQPPVSRTWRRTATVRSELTCAPPA